MCSSPPPPDRGPARALYDVARTPNGGYGANRYQPEEFGIDPERERVHATAYVQRFGIASQLVEASVLREEHGSPPVVAEVVGQRGVLGREQWSSASLGTHGGLGNAEFVVALTGTNGGHSEFGLHAHRSAARTTNPRSEA